MKSSKTIWILLTACCALVLPGRLPAQDEEMAPGPYPAADQAEGQPAPDESQGEASPQDQSASFQTFYDALSSQGNWVQSSDYGYVWQPDVNDPDWAPYTEGNWVYSDAGWTWVSAEPWGWATYHYGRWVNLRGRGWCWVPGYTWAPAWVSWRYGGGYVGWAPLPPDSFYGIDYFDGQTEFSAGFHIGGDSDFFFGIGPGSYAFVPVADLGYRNYHGYYAPRSANFGIINHTTNVTNIIVSPNRGGARAFGQVSVGGPKLAQINAVAEIPVTSVSLAASNRPGGGVVSNRTLAIFAPSVDPGTRTNSRPGRVAGTFGHMAINRGTDVTQPLAVNSRLSPPEPTSTEVQQARNAQAQTPARAKIVTPDTAVQPVFNQPLTALRTLPATGRVVNVPSTRFTSQPIAARPEGGPVHYSQEQGMEPATANHPAAPGAVSPNYSAPQPGTYYHSIQPSTPPAYHSTSNTPAPQGGSAHGGGATGGYSGNYHSGGQSGGSPGLAPVGGASGGYHSAGQSGGSSGGGSYHGGASGGGSGGNSRNGSPPGH